jgi:acetyl-CoA C-acetyltransferase
MTSRPGAAYVAGIYEHPGRVLPDRSLPEIFADVTDGALRDAGLSIDQVDGFFCADEAPGFGPVSLVDYLGLAGVTYLDTTDLGGASYVSHVGHAAMAIAAGKCSVALIVLAGKPRSGPTYRGRRAAGPEVPYETPVGPPPAVALYALAARRHMHEYGTTPQQLAAVKVAASQHAQHNPNAFLPRAVTVDEVLESPIVSSPLHRLDCCVITDGGGAIIVVSDDVARSLGGPMARVIGHGEAARGSYGGALDLTRTAATVSGPRAFAEAGLTPGDIQYASIYDSFTITVLESIENLGFCPAGQGGAFVADGGLLAPHGRLPFNTDGGGLCNNHPGNRGGMTKVIEAVRQLRGSAHPLLQVPSCGLALAHGTGGSLGTRMASATVIMERVDL